MALALFSRQSCTGRNTAWSTSPSFTLTSATRAPLLVVSRQVSELARRCPCGPMCMNPLTVLAAALNANSDPSRLAAARPPLRKPLVRTRRSSPALSACLRPRRHGALLAGPAPAVGSQNHYHARWPTAAQRRAPDSRPKGLVSLRHISKRPDRPPARAKSSGGQHAVAFHALAGVSARTAPYCPRMDSTEAFKKRIVCGRIRPRMRHNPNRVRSLGQPTKT